MATVKTEARWKDRTVGEGVENPKDIIENEANWRIHTAYQQEAMEGVLEDIGWIQPVLVNKNTGVLVDGHMRVALALKRGSTEIPVRYVDITPDEENRILATLNPIGSLAHEDEEARAELAKQVKFESEALRQLLGIISAEDISRDHTEIFGGDDEADDDYDEFLDDSYSDEMIRLITFVMTIPEYEDSIDAIEQICDREGIETNSDAVMWLIEQYADVESETEKA